jgi:phosphoglucomutase
VLQFITADGSIISARPSGTEPKIKFYCSVKAGLNDVNDYKEVDGQLEEKVKKIMEDLAV